MEFGLTSKLEQFNFNSQKHIQTVNKSHEFQPLKDQKETQEVLKKEYLDTNKSSTVNQSPSKNMENYTEVVLTNLNFGFNDTSKDFFVKAIRGSAENQYPTDDMMRLKAFLINQQAS